jgi:hypothetical protein
MLNRFSLIFGNRYGCYIGDAGAQLPISSISWSQTPAPNAAPVINPNGLSPDYGGVLGGASIAISGENFATATQVRIDGVSTAFDIQNDNYISVPSTPAHAAGTVNVTVVNPLGTSNPEQFLYVGAPTVVSISPSSGSELGGTPVTITATNVTLPNGLNLITTVLIGGTLAPLNDVINNVITATTQAHVPEAGVNVQVTTEYGVSAPNTLFTYTPA